MTVTITPAHAQALARSNFAFFCRGAFKELLPTTKIHWNWHLDRIANEIEDVLSGKTRQLIINIPPRYGKSLIVSVALPAFLLGHDPTAEIVCVSYAQDLADKMAFDTRRLMNSAWYQGIFATRLSNPRAKLAELTTTAGGCRLATSTGGMLTGRGGNIVIIDDPLKPSEAISKLQREAVNLWFDTTVTTRTNDKEKGAKILIMQRLHENDLTGHLQAQGNWRVLSLPAIAEADEVHQIRTISGVHTIYRQEGEALHPERESLARIEESKTAMGSFAFAAQYQQRPAPAGGGLVREEWFGEYDPAHLPDCDRIYQSWDTASKASELADFSVCTTWGKKGKLMFLLHVLRKRMEYPELKRTVIAHAKAYEADIVLIEDCASGMALLQDLKAEGLYKVQAVKPQGDKVMRFERQTAAIEAGFILLPRHAGWRPTYLDEVLVFPAGRYDDQVDSTAQALEFMQHHQGMTPDDWMDFLKRDRNRSSTEVPTIRVNHSDLGKGFQLFGGRCPKRELDGSFLVTKEEYEYLENVAGIYRVD